MKRELTSTSTIRVLIVDDEPLARQRITDLLANEPNVEIAGTAANGARAVEAIRALEPDLVFLDVQMPVMTGIDVVRAIGAEDMPATIFVTAHDQYALQAFEVAAVDYLVKPFDDERFEQAFRRARRLIELNDMGQLRQQLLAVLAGAPSGAGAAAASSAETASNAKSYLERVAVDMKGKTRVIPVGEIDFITASGVYAELHVGERRYVIRETMQTLEERLDPRLFMRIHRSAIIRLDLVDTLHRGEGGEYAVQLKSGVRLKVSRSKREALEQRLGVRSGADRVQN